MMDRKTIMEQIQDVCRDVFDDESLTITEETKAEDVEGWDSLTHLTFISELEGCFNMTFSLAEINQSKSIKEILNIICKHKQ